MKTKHFTIGLLVLLTNFSLFAQNLVVEYEFNGTLTDRYNNSTLTPWGPTPDNLRNNIESGFLEDANGTYWYWKSNQICGGGFIVDVNQDISNSYTIGLRLSFDKVTGTTIAGNTSSYRKIIGYANSTSDNGFYFYGSKLIFTP